MLKFRYLIIAFMFLLLNVHCVVWAQEPPRVEPLTISTDQSSTMLSAEVADTEELRQRGLMFRHILPADQAITH